MKRDHKEIYGANSYNSGSSSSKVGSSSSIVNLRKGKLWEEDQYVDAMDELLADLGYKVRSSDMSDVAQKLEQLEMIMGTTQEDEISHLASDTVHYNPSDISGWADSMLIEMNNSTSTTNLDPVSKNHKQIVYNDDSEYDLRVIPDVDVYPPESNPNSDSESTRKRIKTSIGSSSSSISGAVTESPKKTNIFVGLQRKPTSQFFW